MDQQYYPNNATHPKKKKLLQQARQVFEWLNASRQNWPIKTNKKIERVHCVVVVVVVVVVLVHVEHETDGKLCVYFWALRLSSSVFFLVRSLMWRACETFLTVKWTQRVLAVLVTSNCGGRWFTARQSNLPIFVFSPFSRWKGKHFLME
jgi:hypothetical protein